VRRFVRGGYLSDEPGGREVQDFYNRCALRGVPIEAIMGIDINSVRPIRAIGAGSEAARLLATNELMELMPGFDEYGRKAAQRDRVAARFGYDLADRYTPAPDADARPVIDVKIAELENGDMRSGNQVQVLPNENHLEHAKVHLAAIGQIAQAVDAGQIPVEQVIDFLVNLYGHVTIHVEEVSKDITIPEAGAALRQSLQQFGEIVNNGVKRVQKLREQQAAQSAPGAESAAAEQQADYADKLQQKLQEHQAKLQMMQETHQMRLNLRLAEVQQKLALRDAEVASKIAKQPTI
jgi:hypothetical protein